MTKRGYSQWAESEDGTFSPVGSTVAEIQPGYYDLASDTSGRIFFVPLRSRTDDLLQFPDSASLSVLEGLKDFWAREDRFRRYGLPFKRGILMYGPPGSGKSCTVQLVARDVVQRGGIVLTFVPGLFLRAYRALRDIQPDIPVVALMEDLDGIFDSSSRATVSSILNLLDGVEELDRVVFLATTNYPEKLEDRVQNRPSRFDIKILVPRPSAAARRLYLEALVKEDDDLDITAYVNASEGLSLAHLKELFVAVHILGNPFEETAERIQGMREAASSRNDDAPKSPSPYAPGGYA